MLALKAKHNVIVLGISLLCIHCNFHMMKGAKPMVINWSSIRTRMCI
jgi:hypothetical protein